MKFNLIMGSDLELKENNKPIAVFSLSKRMIVQYEDCSKEQLEQFKSRLEKLGLHVKGVERKVR